MLAPSDVVYPQVGDFGQYVARAKESGRLIMLAGSGTRVASGTTDSHRAAILRVYNLHVAPYIASLQSALPAAEAPDPHHVPHQGFLWLVAVVVHWPCMSIVLHAAHACLRQCEPARGARDAWPFGG